MCDEGDINTDKVKFAVFKDGVLTMSAKVKYEKDTEDSDYSDFTVWNYEVSGLPDLEEGEEEPAYGLKDVNYSLNSDREGLFYISDDGSAEPMGAKPCEAVNADFIYVSRSEISGLYEVESESSEIPEDGSVKMAISAADEADCRYLDRPDKAEFSQKTGKWSASELLAYNPETGQPIDWRVEIVENDDDFEASYSNVEFFEGDEVYAYNGGTIFNRFIGESIFSAVGRIQWQDYGDLYGKRPDHLSFIHVFTEDGEDVTDDVTVRATPSEAGYNAADEEWSYEVSGLTKGTSYRVGQELKNYKSEPQFAHITEPAGQGTAGSIELITESTIDRSIKGLIRWKDSKKYGKRPDDLSFLKVLADGEDVTKNVRITLTEAYEKDGDTWEYMVSGMNEGVNYIIQAEEPEGYLANITEVSVISTAKNRLAKDLEASGTLGDEDGGRYISQTGAITLTATKEVSGTVTWNDNDDYWKIRPDKEEMGHLLGIQNSDIQIDVKEDGNVWKYSIKNLPFDMEIRTAVPDGYQSARKWSLFRTGDNGTNLIFKALTHKLTITNTSRGTEGSSESYEFQYKVLTGDGGNETLYNGEYVTGGKRKTAIDGIVQIPANGAAELELPDGTGCKIEQTNQADTFICFDSRVRSITVSSDQTAEFVNTLMTTYIAVKNWNDNNSKSRPADEFKTKVKLYYAVGSGGSREIKDGNLDELGLETVPAAAFKNEDTNMPRLYYTNMPSTTREGTKITYSIQEVPMDGYICTPYSITDENGGKIDGIMNTLESSFHGTKSWKDSGNRYHTRISREKWLELIVLRYTTEAVGGGSFDQSAGTMLNIQTADPDGTAYWNWISDESTDDWTFTIDNLPQFDEKGQEYTYWLEEKDVPLDGSPEYSAGISDVHYEQEYENKGNYTNLLTACFDEGIMQNKLVGTTTYEATKIWLDELTGADREKRPDAILYLYRYPNTDGKNYKTATELKDTRFKDDTEGWLREDDDEKTIHIEISELNIGKEKEKLAAFDEDGTEFIYFIRESMQASGYEQILENVLKPAPDGADSRLFNGGTLKNRRKGNASVGVSKKWTADALQGMDASVTFTLEQRLKNLPASEDNPWEPAGEETLSGFTAEMMTKSLAFSTSRFDEYGREYEFRIAESEIRIDGKTAQSVTDEDGNTIFYAEPIDDHGVRKEDYYYFEMTETGTEQTDGNKIVKLDEGGIGTVDVENKLTGKTKIGVKKRWKGGKPAKDYELSFHIMRDGSDICGELDETLKNNPDHKGVFKFTSEKEKLIQDKDDVDTWWTGLVDYKNSLSKYDENGKEYNYKVKEDPVDGYAYAEYTYEKDHGHKAAVVTNYPPGEGKSIWVTKIWQDESDTIHRFPVKAQLYKSRDNKPVDGKTVILREENDWTGWIGVDEGELDDYFILESAVSRSNDEKEWADVKYNGGFRLDASDGDVETSKHYYQVENKKISKSEYEITNTRYGFVDVSLTKNWIDGDSEPVAAEFKLTRKSPAGEADHTESYTLDGKPDTEYQNGNGKETKAWKLDITGLDKYDEKGRLYSYFMVEVKVGDQDTTGGAFTLYGEPYVCSVSGGTYELGVDGDNVTHHKRDRIAFEAVNQKSDTVLSPMIHKIWKDDGPLESSRPDIYLELWKEYKISGRTELKQEQVDGVNYHWDKVKDGAAETNHWIGIFESSLPLYTNEGYPITYYVKEGVHVSSDYKLYYGKDAPKNNDWEMGSGLGEVPGLDGDSGNPEYELSQGAPLGGTIINIPSAERTVSGKKIWQNMGVLHSEDYPEIELKLYRMKAGYILEDSGNDSSAWEEAKDMDGNLVESFHLRSGLPSFEFTGLPKYDKNTGKMIIYAVREENTPMGFEAMDPEYNHDFHLVNTYHESTEYAIQLNKVWDVAAAELAAAGEYPEADVHLERVMKAPDGAGTLEYTRNTAYKKGVITKLSSAPDSYGCRFTDLPKYAPNGLEYQYEVREVQINGYNEVTKLPVGAFEGEAKEAAAELTNTYDGDTSDNQFANIIVTKKWNDSSSFYGTRPASDKLHFQVYRKAEGYTYTAPGDPDRGENITDWLIQKTVSSDSGSDIWSYTFTPDISKPGHNGELRRYAANGKPYVYTIVESKVDGYNDSKEISVSKGAPAVGTELAAELTNKLDTVSLDVQKNWDDDENVYLTRPDEIRVQIERSIDGHQNWTPYKIKDEAADENGIVTITKSNSAGTDQNNWKRGFSGLPKYDYSSGSRVLAEYRVREVFDGSAGSIVNYDVPVYSDSVKAGTDFIAYQTEITNTLRRSGEVTSFSAKKAWDDNDNLDGLRPESVTFILVRDGKELPGKTAVIDGTEDPGAAPGDGREYEPWTVQWDDLPKLKADGSGESRYSVKESAASGGTDDKPLPGYTTEYGLNGSGVYIVTNRHAEIANISLTAEKKWNDGDDAWKLRPSEIKASLYQWYAGISGNEPIPYVKDGSTYEIALNAGNDWKGTFEGLPYMHREGDSGKGSIIYYSVKEKALDGEGKNLIGSYSLGSSWTGGNAPSGSDSGKGFSPSDHLAEKPAMTVTMTNSIQEVSCRAEKVWADNKDAYGTRPEEVTVGLYRRQKGGTGEAEWKPVLKSDGSAETAVFLKLTGGTDWKGEFKGLPAKDRDGTEFEYKVFELDSSGNALEENTELGNYTVTYHLSTDEFGFKTVITNTAKAAGSVSVEKVWKDGGNQDGIRPAALTVHLQASTDGASYSDFDKRSAVDLNEANGWKYQWDALPERNTDGKEYSYRIVEEWPADQTADPWSALYTAGDGQKNGITVVPADLSNTSSASDGEKAAASASFTNSYTPRTLSVTASKTWAGDSEVKDITRPETLTFTLYRQAEGKQAEKYVPLSGSSNTNPVTLNKPSDGSEVWTDTAAWSDLPVSMWDSERERSRKITYWVVETPIQGYEVSQSALPENLFGCTAAADGDLCKVTGKTGLRQDGAPTPEKQTAVVTVTNTLNAVEKKVAKLWDQDSVWGDDSRPDEIQVQLYKSYTEDGSTRKEAVGAPVTLSGSDPAAAWTYTWKNLPRYQCLKILETTGKKPKCRLCIRQRRQQAVFPDIRSP
ncbi:Cna B-type domain-containing protein [Clostridium sp. AM58-1XD]|uniref:Cna B-type domain-containing protein n=1 Tax=Clostridium sp. AM58-1XD TaxID=2292307 RepID=UPI002683DE19